MCVKRYHTSFQINYQQKNKNRPFSSSISAPVSVHYHVGLTNEAVDDTSYNSTDTYCNPYDSYGVHQGAPHLHLCTSREEFQHVVVYPDDERTLEYIMLSLCEVHVTVGMLFC